MRKLVAVVGVVVALGAGSYALSSVLPAGAQSRAAVATNGPAGPRGERIKGVLDGLVADGTISQDQEDKIIAALKEAAPDPGPGFGRRHPRILKAAVETAAKALDMSTDDLKAELKAGKSVADVAADKGVALDTVTQALTDAANTAIDKAVADGMLSADRAAEIKAKLPDAITRFENATRPEGGFGGRHPGPDAAPPTSSS
jgi:polyhydroxyalkanoate synthesis regulator phasin